MSHGFRRFVSTAVAVWFVASSVLVCAPVAAAQAPEGHCKPANQQADRHCPPASKMDCCATSAPKPASVPQNDQQGTRVLTASVLQADTDAVACAVDLPGLARTLRAAPVHGYRSIDLLTLNAVFLI